MNVSTLHSFLQFILLSSARCLCGNYNSHLTFYRREKYTDEQPIVLLAKRQTLFTLMASLIQQWIAKAPVHAHRKHYLFFKFFRSLLENCVFVLKPENYLMFHVFLRPFCMFRQNWHFFFLISCLSFSLHSVLNVILLSDGFFHKSD